MQDEKKRDESRQGNVEEKRDLKKTGSSTEKRRKKKKNLPSVILCRD